MKRFFWILTMAIASTAVGQPVDQPATGGNPPVIHDVGDGSDQNPISPAPVETVPDSIPSPGSPVDNPMPPPDQPQDNSPERREIIHRAEGDYLAAKVAMCNAIANHSRDGLRQAEAKLCSCERLLDQLRRHDQVQDKRLDVHSGLVWQHEHELNGQNGLATRLAKLESEFRKLNGIPDASPKSAPKKLPVWPFIGTASLLLLIGAGKLANKPLKPATPP